MCFGIFNHPFRIEAIHNDKEMDSDTKIWAVGVKLKGIKAIIFKNRITMKIFIRVLGDIFLFEWPINWINSFSILLYNVLRVFSIEDLFA
jgi:hypothetical protein